MYRTDSRNISVISTDGTPTQCSQNRIYIRNRGYLHLECKCETAGDIEKIKNNEKIIFEKNLNDRH